MEGLYVHMWRVNSRTTKSPDAVGVKYTVFCVRYGQLVLFISHWPLTDKYTPFPKSSFPPAFDLGSILEG